MTDFQMEVDSLDAEELRSATRALLRRTQSDEADLLVLLAAIDERVRCFVLEGEGRAAERARDAVRALDELGCEVRLVPTEHPVVDIVRFQLLTIDLAEARGVDPDPIRTDDERWKRARAAYE